MSDQQHPSGSLAPRIHRFRFSWLFSLIPYLVLIGTALGSLPASAAFTQVDAGWLHTCGIKRGGAVACWGSDYTGQATSPAGVFTQVSAGRYHTCGLKSDDTVACWGYNDDGRATPPAGTFTQVSAGGFHTCGVTSGGAVACWGYNDDGRATPPAGTFTQVSAGGDHTCGLKSDHTVACWGSNNNSQATAPDGVFTQVSAGESHTCGLKSDHTVACWGLNTDGRATAPDGVFTQVSAGDWHTCGLKSDHTVACWGYNDDGQATLPAETLTQVSAGFLHTCGLKSDDTVACWGNRTYGQATYPWDWDAGQDFSATENPTGPWSYGWSLTQEGPFISSDLPFSLPNTLFDTVQFWFSLTNLSFIPVSNHLGDDLLVVDSEALQLLLGLPVPPFAAVVPPYTMLMYPGPNGEYSVVRWTAPAARSYLIGGQFWGLDSKPTTTDVAVFHNETMRWSGNVISFMSYNDPATSFNVEICANRGDAVDFKVGYGNGSNYNDMTALLALIDKGYASCTYYPLTVDYQGMGHGTVTSNRPDTTIYDG